MNTIDEVIEAIRQATDKYTKKYDVAPFALCLGPKECRLLSGDALIGSSIPSYFFGMRIYRMLDAGVSVGNLEHITNEL